MSIPALNWAIAQRLQATQKLVLLTLGHRHNQKTGQCNPSLSTLMADTGLSRSTIKVALGDLEALKLIRSSRRKAAGRDLSNQYELLLENAASGKRKGARADLQGGREPAPGRGLEPSGPGADPMGPGAGLNKEGKRKKDPSQKKKWKRIQEKTYRPALRVVGAEDVVPDDPFGDMS